MNNVVLIGRLGKDPELKLFENGGKTATMSVATSENYQDKQGEWQQKTEWHRVVVWGEKAQYYADSKHKGDLVSVEGKITYRTYQDRDGQERHMTEIVAHRITTQTKANTQQSNTYDPGQSYQAAPFASAGSVPVTVTGNANAVVIEEESNLPF